MILKYLKNNENFSELYSARIPPKQVYQMGDTDIDDLHAALADVDVLLIQPVTDDYRSPVQVDRPAGALSARTLIDKIKPGGQVIMTPVMFFNAYHPAYFRPGLRKPTDNHDVNLLGLYGRAAAAGPLSDADRGALVDAYIAKVEDPFIYSADELMMKVDQALESLRNKEQQARAQSYARQVNFLAVSEFVSRNYDKKLLFRTCNHPTHAMYEYLVPQVAELLGLDAATFPDLAPHAEDTGIYYRALEQIVSFDVSQGNPRLHDAVTVPEIAHLYLSAYEADTARMIELSKKYLSR